MRMVLDVAIPNEPFNSLVKSGTAGEKIQQILGDIQPEAVYFTERNGERGAILVLDVPDSSRIPAVSEPFFLAFNASVKLRICMSPDDLGAAGLDEIGKHYA